MSIGDVTKMLTDFEKAGMKMEMKNDAMNDAMGMGEDNGEADEIYGAIMGEIGMNVEMGAATGVGAIQSNKIPAKAAVQEESKNDAEVDDLEARMAALGGMWKQLDNTKTINKNSCIN